MSNSFRWWLALSSVLVSGCAMEAPAESTDGPEIEPEGVSLNGVSLNGVSLNGVSLNGVSLNGVSLNGVSLNGSQLVGVRSGVTVRDVGFVGSVFTGQLSNGTSLTLRVDSMMKGDAPNQDVWMAGVSFASSTGYQPLCGLDTGVPVLAIPLSGTWNYGQGVAGGGSFTRDATHLTFACRKTAIAKCVELGYKPWIGAFGLDLTNHMVACTRLLRADYCGDGTPNTVNGTTLDVYDALGIQKQDETWLSEAEWTAAGARCVQKDATLRWELVSSKAPTCIAHLASSTCTKPPNYLAGTLIVDEYRDAVATSGK